MNQLLKRKQATTIRKYTNDEAGGGAKTQFTQIYSIIVNIKAHVNANKKHEDRVSKDKESHSL